MHTAKEEWTLAILDGLIPCRDAASLAVGDIDGDGRMEIVVGGDGALLWYRPDTLERGVIDEGGFGVGVVLEDIDGDGILEIVAGKDVERRYKGVLMGYKPSRVLSNPWLKFPISKGEGLGSHDILFADIDADGERELVCTGCPGVYLFKRGDDFTKPWRKHVIDGRHYVEGLNTGDFDADGRLEVICGPDLYIQPQDGPYAGEWERKVYAPGLREMCRTAVIDIAGNGRPDIIAMESEYMDGRISWFENRYGETPEWMEHFIAGGMVFGHSLSVWEDRKRIHLFAAEMAQGGWDPPYNHDARLMELVTGDHGNRWETRIIGKGMGTHQAVAVDMDADGEREIIGKTWSPYWKNPKLQCWKRSSVPLFDKISYNLIDRDKEYAATDLLWVDVDGDHQPDIVCGAWWYKSPDWQKYLIPGIDQVINHYDIDGDGAEELICTAQSDNKLHLSNEICWIKAVDPEKGLWERHPIGIGSGDWPHGSVVAPLLPGGKPALVLGYHGSHYRSQPPELFSMPDNPRERQWEKTELSDLQYGEEMIAYDIDGDGNMDIIAGCHILRNMGDGSFKTYTLAEGLDPARIALMDVNGDGNMDIVIGEGIVDYTKKVAPFSRLLWLENPGNPFEGQWTVHIIDTLRCPHSVAAADIDADGEPEIICGEHDPFSPYRSRCRLMAYKKADPAGKTWRCHVLDDRFEHHDGVKPLSVGNGLTYIASHGWSDSQYVHLWTVRAGRNTMKYQKMNIK